MSKSGSSLWKCNRKWTLFYTKWKNAYTVDIIIHETQNLNWKNTFKVSHSLSKWQKKIATIKSKLKLKSETTYLLLYNSGIVCYAIFEMGVVSQNRLWTRSRAIVLKAFHCMNMKWSHMHVCVFSCAVQTLTILISFWFWHNIYILSYLVCVCDSLQMLALLICTDF